MADELQWTFELTRERVPELQVQLEWALQHQNRRFASRMRGNYGRIRQRLVLGLCGFGYVFIALIYLLSPEQFRANPAFFIAMLIVFTVLAASATVFKGLVSRKSSQRFAGGMLTRQAARMYRKPAAQAPYEITYTCSGDHVRARADKLGIDRTLALRDARLVIHAPDVMFVFRRAWSFHPFRFIYVSGEVERRALLDSLDRLKIDHVPITGPVENYVAPVPDVRVVR
jgi:hypothetical protein